MKKVILLTDRGSVEMTFEEVLVQFDRLIDKFANLAISKIVYNKPEKEDLIQELHIYTWLAYLRYDSNTEIMFSTYLWKYLMGANHRSTAKLFAKKRINENGTVSLNQPLSSEDDGTMVEELFGDECLEISSLAFRDFVEKFEKKLDPVEKRIFKVIMDRSDLSVRDLGDELGMSRQGANKKVNKFKIKVAQELKSAGFVE